MSVVLWRIATDARDYGADDLSGKGAAKTGGRWNRVDQPVVYTATSISLACLETIVHLQSEGLPLNRFLVRIDVPEAVWAARLVRAPDSLPVGWSAIPEGKVSLDVGDAWLRSMDSPLLVVPSVVVPEEANVLINPQHVMAQQLQAAKLRPWFYDQRMR